MIEKQLDSQPRRPAPAGERWCVACGASGPHRVVYEKWSYPILRCSRCGLGATRVPDNFDPATIYDQSYYQGGQHDGYADYEGSEPVLRAEFQRTLDFIGQQGKRSGKLLELGCAYGFFLELARQRFDAVGVEISEAAAEACRKRGLDVLQGDLGQHLDELRKRGPFDVIVMLDCIEHLAEPDRMIEQLRGLLKPGGLIVLTTGDWGSPLARLLGKRWRLMTPPQHLFFFSESTLRRLFERLGLQVIAAEHPWKVVPVGLALYQVSSRLGLPLKASGRLGQLGVPVNLFDALRFVARLPEGGAGPSR